VLDQLVPERRVPLERCWTSLDEDDFAELTQTNLESIRVERRPQSLDVDGEGEEKSIERRRRELGKRFDESIEHEAEDRDRLLDEDGEAILRHCRAFVVEEVADDGVEVLEEDGVLEVTEVGSEDVLDSISNLDRVGYCGSGISLVRGGSDS
jgi:hypothetical protein